MIHSLSIRAFSAILLLAPAVAADPPQAKKPVEAKIPYACFTMAWAEPFEILSTRYDKPGNRIIWTLRVKKDGPLAAYEGFVADPDGVPADTIKVKFTPAGPKVKANARLQAVLPLGTLDGDPSKITIRLCK